MLGGALLAWVLQWALDAWFWRRNSIQAVDLTPVQRELHRKDAAHLHQHLEELAPAPAPTGAFLAGEDEASLEPVRPTAAAKVFDPNVDQPQQPSPSPIRIEGGPIAPIEQPLGNAAVQIENAATSAIPKFTFPYIERGEELEQEPVEDRGPVLPGLEEEPILADRVVLKIAEREEQQDVFVEQATNGAVHHEAVDKNSEPDAKVEPERIAHRDEAHRKLQEALRQVAHLKDALARRGIPHDDLQSIRGIGPFAEHKLVAAGIDTFKALAEKTEEEIVEIIQPQSWQPIHAAQWIADARTKLAEGDQA